MAAEESWPQREDACEQRDGCDTLAFESLPVHGILVKHVEEWRNTEAWTLTVPTRLCTSFGFLLHDTHHRVRRKAKAGACLLLKTLQRLSRVSRIKAKLSL